MLTAELNKGDFVALRGTHWLAYLLSPPDVESGIVTAKVYGDYTESGDIYLHDIEYRLEDVTDMPDENGNAGMFVLDPKTEKLFKVTHSIELTKEEKDFKEEVDKWLGQC